MKTFPVIAAAALLALAVAGRQPMTNNTRLFLALIRILNAGRR